ncbi:hypothetical protein [Paenibacillus sp. FSL H8-0259]|uniref:hypothetical protein n=1 Tax=Paenibacillus sp. FSL H8-0259 TaxID=1920423 RepID=UPI0015C37D86|nr:hypothetical protein [Paenibacillus sp. FSL H8-0259]
MRGWPCEKSDRRCKLGGSVKQAGYIVWQVEARANGIRGWPCEKSEQRNRWPAA